MLSERDRVLLEAVQRLPDVYVQGWEVPYELLGRQLTLQEVQKELRLNIDMTKEYPFEDMDTTTKLFFMRIRRGDEIRDYRSPPWTWAMRQGTAAIALVRNGKVIHGLVTAIS